MLDTSSNDSKENNFSGWQFRTLDILKWLYPIGIFVWSAASLGFAFMLGLEGTDYYTTDIEKLLRVFGLAIFFIIVSNVIWRLACERAAIPFRIYDRLALLTTPPPRSPLTAEEHERQNTSSL